MASRFKLQIVEKATGDIVLGLEPGSKIETDLIEDFMRRLKGYGVGMFKSEAKVEAAATRAWEELLYDLKRLVRG